jgi:hypothetical protein
VLHQQLASGYLFSGLAAILPYEQFLLILSSFLIFPLKRQPKNFVCQIAKTTDYLGNG